MRAAQNQVPTADEVVTELLHTLPTRAFNLFADLPLWLRTGVVLVLVATFCAPRLLRALDDHLFNRQARKNITQSADWVEVVRIRNEPRRLWGRRATSSSTAGNEPPGTTSDTASNEVRGEAEDQPP